MPPSRRTATALRILRKGHAWVGLAGAAFGLLFGVSAILLNHRGMWKLNAGHVEERKVQLDLPSPPASPEALAQELAARLSFPPHRAKVLVQPKRSVRVAGQDVASAEQWTVALFGHKHFATAVFVPGNHSVAVDLKDADAFALLKRLHKGDGGQPAWIVVADAVAGGLIFLVLSGLLLWTRLAGTRLLALGLALGGLLTGALVVARGW